MVGEEATTGSTGLIEMWKVDVPICTRILSVLTSALRFILAFLIENDSKLSKSYLDNYQRCKSLKLVLPPVVLKSPEKPHKKLQLR
jgi:hypothetical protein